ncbi:hypothetical protein BGX29_003772 [Mortierella sp. GBA35]|nr:hypothetical protein BGX29_003772 [Mortierella sp. GBA35]
MFCGHRQIAQTQKDEQPTDAVVDQLNVAMASSERPVESTDPNESSKTLIVAAAPKVQKGARLLKWTNRARNQTCRPSKILRPRTIQDIVEIVQNAKAEGKKIRCVAGGFTWSSSSVVEDDGLLIVVDKMTKIFTPVHVEGQGWTVELETGVTIKALDEFLRKHNPPLAMTSNLMTDSVCFGGIMALGSHGSTTHSRTLPDLASEVKIVDANGTLNTFTREKDPIEFSAAACNLGLLGIIYSYTVRIEPMYNLKTSDTYPLRVDYYGDCPKLGGARLKELVAQNDQIQILCWVFNGHYGKRKQDLDYIWIKQWKRTELPETGTARWKYVRFVRQFVANSLGSMLLKVMAANPKITPLINSGISAGCKTGFEKILEAPDAIHYQSDVKNVPCIGFECVFKVDEGFENASKAWKFVIDKIHEYAARGEYPVNMVLDMRFIKSSDQLMSYAYDEDPEAVFCTIDIVSVAKTKGVEDFTAVVAQYWMDEFKARPHWAKRWEHIPGIVPYLRDQAGPQLELFESVRRKYDPQGMFMNKTFAGVLGH